MNKRWPLYCKIGFFFLAFYFVVYGNSSQFFFSFVFEGIWRKIIPWFAQIMGHDTAITIFTNGSGDTTYNYYQIYFFAILAALGALVFAFIKIKDQDMDLFHRLLTTFLRYYLASQMISYGFAKVFYLQFRFPSAARLDQELGDFSPMGLLWTFMGYSKGYTIFTGALELLGGLLLLSRKTTTLGALVTFGVMLNVMMLNFCYDVPVKILSSHLVMMSLFLILLDGKRLAQFFIGNKISKLAVPPSIVPPNIEKAKNIVKWSVLGIYFTYSLFSYAQRSLDYGPNAPKPLFYGKYAVESFYQYDDSLQLKTVADSVRWEAFYQSWKGHALIKTGSEKIIRFKFNPDTVRHILEISSYKDDFEDELFYERLDSTRYHVYGIFQKDSLDMIFRKEDINKRLLVKRGFHWINEYPFNR